MKHLFYSALILIFIHSCQSDDAVTYCDVVVLGEGTGAVAAAIQSARSGAQTILVNPQPWLGGMLTSAGVSATDGNHKLPAGLWGEFRELLRRHYGGADSLFTGWVSNTMFEPSVGARYWQQLAGQEQKLIVHNNATWSTPEKGQRWTVTVQLENGQTEKVKAWILIDGTDLGDVAAAVGAGYDLGMDARRETGEEMAPEQANRIIQDLTYVAILKDFGDSTHTVLTEPEGYDPAAFHCSCRDFCDIDQTLPCEQMLQYGKLPNGKYMINWPNHGNDYYTQVVELGYDDRMAAYEQAKLHTLRFVYYIQHELGFHHLGLADDEFPTSDKLALMPYHREGRRIHGMVRMNVNHILNPYNTNVYRTGIAVGDYPIDHHHGKNPEAPEIDFPKVPSFSIPLGSLIPKDVSNLVIADKALSVTNIVNGSSRLQPVIIQTGQVAGLVAAMASKAKLTPAEMDIREIQDNVIEAGGYLMPYIDVPDSAHYFGAVQRLGATGILRGTGVPFQWANQTWFYPDTLLTVEELETGFHDFGFEPGDKSFAGGDRLTIGMFMDRICQIRDANHLKNPYFENRVELSKYLMDHWQSTLGLSAFDESRPATKMEIAVLLDHLIDPFHLKKVTFTGDWK